MQRIYKIVRSIAGRLKFIPDHAYFSARSSLKKKSARFLHWQQKTVFTLVFVLILLQVYLIAIIDPAKMVADEMKLSKITYQGLKKIDPGINVYPKLEFTQKEDKFELEYRLPMARFSENVYPVNPSGKGNSKLLSEVILKEIDRNSNLYDGDKDLPDSLIETLNKSEFCLDTITKDLERFSFMVLILDENKDISLKPDQREKYEKIKAIQRTLKKEHLWDLRDVIMTGLWDRQLRQIFVYITMEGDTEEKSTLPPLNETAKIALKSIENPEAYREKTPAKCTVKKLTELEKKIISNKYSLHRWNLSQLVWGITKLQKDPGQCLNKEQVKIIKPVLMELDTYLTKVDEINSLRKGLLTAEQKEYLEEFIVDKMPRRRR